MAKERMTTEKAYELVNQYNEDRENHANWLRKLNLSWWQIFNLLRDRDKENLTPEIKEAMSKVKKANKRAYDTAKWILWIDDTNPENRTDREKEDLRYQYEKAKKWSYDIVKGRKNRLSHDLKTVESDIRQKRKKITSILKEILWNQSTSPEDSTVNTKLNKVRSIIEKDLKGDVFYSGNGDNNWEIKLFSISLPFEITDLLVSHWWDDARIKIKFDKISYDRYFHVGDSKDIYKHINELDNLEIKLDEYRKKQIKNKSN